MNLLPILAALGLAAAQYFIWIYAPLEATMGLAQKIFYIHLPLAWWSFASFFLVFVGSAMYLWKRDAFWDRLSGAACEVGVLHAVLALITGSLWARPIWNVWWTWDPRLTTTLIMVFVYLAYLLLRSSDMGLERKRMVCSVLGVIAFLDVPLVFISARRWRGVHPVVFGEKGGGLEPEMWTAVLVCLAVWSLLWLSLVVMRTRQLGCEARLAGLSRWQDNRLEREGLAGLEDKNGI